MKSVLFLSLISLACQSATEEPRGQSDERRVVAAIIPQMQEQTRLEWIRYKNSGFVAEDAPSLTDAQRTTCRATFKALQERQQGVREALFRISAAEGGVHLITIVYLRDFEFDGRILDPIVVNHAVVEIRLDGSLHFLPQA